MIKTAIIYFILDKCLDRLESQIEFNMMPPEVRKVVGKWTMLDKDTARRIADRIIELSEQIQNIEHRQLKGRTKRYAEAQIDESYFRVVSFGTIGESEMQ